jgi:hypothetical protein
MANADSVHHDAAAAVAVATWGDSDRSRRELGE